MQKSVAIVLAFCAVLSACSGGSSGEAAAPEASSESASETTLASTPIAEVDFDAVYRELDATRQEASDEDDPEKLAQVSGHKQSITDLTRRVEDGHQITRSDDYSYTIDDVTVFEIVDEDRVSLRVTDSVVGESVKLDADGNEIDRWSRETPERTFIVVLERTEVDDWKIHLDWLVPNDFPESFSDFTEQKTFELGDKNVVFSTATFGDTECYILALESEPTIPRCLDDSLLEGSLQTYFSVSYDGEYEAYIGVKEPEDAVFTIQVDDEDQEFFGSRNNYAVKVAEQGALQEAVIYNGVDRTPADLATLREGVLQERAGTYVPEESDTTTQETTPPTEPPAAPAKPAAPAAPAAPPAPAEPAPGVNQPGGPTVEVTPDGEIIVGVGG